MKEVQKLYGVPYFPLGDEEIKTDNIAKLYMLDLDEINLTVLYPLPLPFKIKIRRGMLRRYNRFKKKKTFFVRLEKGLGFQMKELKMKKIEPSQRIKDLR